MPSFGESLWQVREAGGGTGDWPLQVGSDGDTEGLQFCYCTQRSQQSGQFEGWALEI